MLPLTENPMARAPRKLDAHVVSHTHWDRAWYWTFEESRLRLVDLLDDLIELLDRDPGFRHFVLDGQLAMVLDYLALRPGATRRVGELVRDGRLCLGPFLVLPDLFIPRGESLVRNLRLGRAAARELGPSMPVGYLPDPFGLPAQLPQILRGFGIDGAFLSRGVGDEGEHLGSDFRWRAPDGSEVLATHQLAGGYCNLARLGDGLEGEQAIAAACERIREVAGALAPHCPSGVLLLGNGCDHLPAQPELPTLLAAARAELGREGIELRHSTPPAYQRAVRRAIRLGRFEPALHQGELRGSRYANLLPGVLSSRVDLKLALDVCERELLHFAEPFSAIASILGASARDDRAALEHAWRLILLSQPHDDICGCSIDPVHEDDRNRLSRAAQVARAVASRALSAIASRVSSPGRGLGAVAFNPHPFPLPTRIELCGWRGGVAGPEGPLPSQRIAAGVLAQVELPPLGWLALASSGQRNHAAVAGAVRVRRPGPGNVVLENDRLRVTIARSGALRLGPVGGSRPLHRVELCDEADAGDTYDFSPLSRPRTIVGFEPPPRIRILERGPLRGRAEISGHLSLPVGLVADRRARASRKRRVPVRIEVSLEAGASLCALELTVENTVDDHRLRLRLRTKFRAEAVFAGAPFQVVSRALSGRTPRRPGWAQQPAATVPLEGFAAIEERSRGGVALLAPGLHELDGHPLGGGTELQLTLLRSVRWLSRADLRTRRGHAGPGLPVEGARQLGPSSFRIGILLYDGSWTRAGVPRVARAHASPPRVVEVSPACDATLSSRGSFLAIDHPAIELAALEAGPEAGTLIARLVNLESRRAHVSLEGPFRRARRLRLDGTPLPGRVELGAVELRAAEIGTLRLETDADPSW
jgi:alpha-mannosidase